jgi:hypothetical protein
MTGGLVATATGRAENYFAVFTAISAARLTNYAVICTVSFGRTTRLFLFSTVLAYLVDNVTT